MRESARNQVLRVRASVFEFALAGDSGRKREGERGREKEREGERGRVRERETGREKECGGGAEIDR